MPRHKCGKQQVGWQDLLLRFYQILDELDKVNVSTVSRIRAHDTLVVLEASHKLFRFWPESRAAFDMVLEDARPVLKRHGIEPRVSYLTLPFSRWLPDDLRLADDFLSNYGLTLNAQITQEATANNANDITDELVAKGSLRSAVEYVTNQIAAVFRAPAKRSPTAGLPQLAHHNMEAVIPSDKTPHIE